MVLRLVVLALAGTISGLLSGAYWGGPDGLILGGSTGFTFGVMLWFVANTVRQAVHDRRLNRYFSRDEIDS